MKMFLLILSTLFFAGCATVRHEPLPVSPTAAGVEHWVVRDGLKISLWEKNGTQPEARPRVILCVHGATWAGRPDFDLQIRDYSLMDALARDGWDAWSIDIHGYGHSDRPTDSKDWVDTKSAEKDVAAALETIMKLRGVEQVALLGWSWGTQIAGLYTMNQPDRVSKLILYAPIWKSAMRGVDAPKPVTHGSRANTDANAREDFVPGQYEQDVVDLYAHEALAGNPRSPNGVLVDIRNKLPLLDPTRIRVPTLVIQAQHDPVSTLDDILPFYEKLATKDRAHVLLPAGGHAIMLERSHRRFQAVVMQFLDSDAL